MSGGPARRITPRDPLSMAIEATSPRRSTTGDSAGAGDVMTWIITISATSTMVVPIVILVVAAAASVFVRGPRREAVAAHEEQAAVA